MQLIVITKSVRFREKKLNFGLRLTHVGVWPMRIVTWLFKAERILDLTVRLQRLKENEAAKTKFWWENQKILNKCYSLMLLISCFVVVNGSLCQQIFYLVQQLIY